MSKLKFRKYKTLDEALANPTTLSMDEAVLTTLDFKATVTRGSEHYLSFITENNEYEICLEQCFNGFDVAVYENATKNLIGEKVCTNLKYLDYRIAVIMAIELANQLYKKHCKNYV